MNPYDKYFGEEDRLHIACCDYLDLQYPNVLYTHPANESKRSNFERYKAMKLRMKPGVPDLLIFQPASPFVGLAVEFKIGKNKESKNQTEWHEKLRKNGWYVFTCYDLDTFINLMKDYI